MNKLIRLGVSEDWLFPFCEVMDYQSKDWTCAIAKARMPINIARGTKVPLILFRKTNTSLGLCPVGLLCNT